MPNALKRKPLAMIQDSDSRLSVWAASTRTDIWKKLERLKPTCTNSRNPKPTLNSQEKVLLNRCCSFHADCPVLSGLADTERITFNTHIRLFPRRHELGSYMQAFSVCMYWGLTLSHYGYGCTADYARRHYSETVQQRYGRFTWRITAVTAVGCSVTCWNPCNTINCSIN